MKIALITPRNSSGTEKSFYEYGFFSRFLLSRKYFSYLLAIPTLASLTPEGHDIRVFDENIEDIDYGWDADLAGISVRTSFAKRAYGIAEEYRRRGVKTVLGGIHSSMCADEALRHCDSVVVGEAEGVWPALLRDAEEGRLKSLYKAAEPADLTALGAPDRSVLSSDRYFADVLQTTKGCPFHCEFCSVHAFDGTRIRNKTVGQVIKEVESLHGGSLRYKKKAVFFADDNIIADRKFARELFTALKPCNIKWGCQASINVARDEEMLGLMRDSGCGSMLIGLESVSRENLAHMDKQVNLRHDYGHAIRTIQSYGIRVDGSFILGYDFDTPESFDELIRFIDETNMLMPLINILTPFPGTRLFKRLEEEGRIIHKDWSRYDTKHVVFSHPTMTPEELLEGYRKVVRHAYSFGSIYRKLKHYGDMDFWGPMNDDDPIRFRYRLVFALRLCTLLFSLNFRRSRFIVRILPKVLGRRTRISVILALMAHNDYAYSQ
ncbi:MAG: radical SAM protein [Thermodesulfovibrionales bacterium]